jgi:hypothetical protein
MRRTLVAAVLGLLLAAGAARAEDWVTRDYVAAGVPDPVRVWSLPELRQAVDAIGRAAAGHAERLPRYRSTRSGVLFARLIEPLREDPAGAVADRLIMHVERFGALNELNKLYGVSLEAPPQREQLELYGEILREAVALEGMVAPFLATFRADDPSLPTRRDGLAKMRAGNGTMLLGCVLVAEDLRVEEAQRVTLLRRIAPAAAALVPKLPADAQSKFRDELGKLVTASRGALHAAAVGVQAALDREH